MSKEMTNIIGLDGDESERPWERSLGEFWGRPLPGIRIRFSLKSAGRRSPIRSVCAGRSRLPPCFAPWG